MKLQAPWITVIGIGEDGIESLNESSKSIIKHADTIIGGKRHLKMIPYNIPDQLEWLSPLVDTIPLIEKRRNKRVVILATGDPMHFGIAVTLQKYFNPDEMQVLPALSALTLACARLMWPIDKVKYISLHGRPSESVRSYFAPGHKLVILAHDSNTPKFVAEALCDSGYEKSKITVLENMSGKTERQTTELASKWNLTDISPLNTIAVDCIESVKSKRYFMGLGLRDRAFENDGQLTKREIRLLTLGALTPRPGALLWDIGAGSGSIGIEWLLINNGVKAIAIEKDTNRAERISNNAVALGVPHLKVVNDDALQIVHTLPPPDAIFIGGGIGAIGLVEACWDLLKPNGQLVANCVSIENERHLIEWHNRLGGDMTRINISRGSSAGAYKLWKSLTPVTQWAVKKPYRKE